MLLAEEMIRFDGDIGLPDMSYGWAKLTAEYLARLAHDRHGLRTICFRPFAGYGEDQDAACPFPAICRRVLDHRGARVLEVWGSGQQMRDFIHVDDCIRGILGMLDRIEDGAAVNLLDRHPDQLHRAGRHGRRTGRLAAGDPRHVRPAGRRLRPGRLHPAAGTASASGRGSTCGRASTARCGIWRSRRPMPRQRRARPDRPIRDAVATRGGGRPSARRTPHAGRRGR